MSKHAHPIAVQYSSVEDLVQEVRQVRSPMHRQRRVRVEPLCMRIGALRVWGILLSSYRHQEEHTAWVVVAQAHLYMVTPFKEEAASRQQQQLYDALVAYLHSRQLEVGRGVYTPPK